MFLPRAKRRLSKSLAQKATFLWREAAAAHTVLALRFTLSPLLLAPALYLLGGVVQSIKAGASPRRFVTSVHLTRPLWETGPQPRL